MRRTRITALAVFLAGTALAGTIAAYIDADGIKLCGQPAAVQGNGDVLGSTQSHVAAKEYQVFRVFKGPPRLDGRLESPEWKQAVAEKRFVFPWEKTTPPATVFKALVDDEFLYFAFDVHDETPVVEEPFTSKTAVAKEDRVELFFAPDDTLTKYYCLEFDRLGRVLDYAASYHRHFDNTWKFPAEVKTAATQTKTGYIVEGRIPLAALESLKMPSLRAGRAIKVGTFPRRRLP